MDAIKKQAEDLKRQLHRQLQDTTAAQHDVQILQLQIKVKEDEAKAKEAELAKLKEESAEQDRKLRKLQEDEAKLKAKLQKTRDDEEARLETMGMDDVTKYNIGVIGNTGVGKSTLVGSLMNSPSNISHGVESKAKVTPHVWPGTPLVLWDIPGGDGDFSPAASYCNDHCLDLFDLLIICYKDRVTALMIKIVEFAVLQSKVPFVVVYTNADTTVANMQRDAKLRGEQMTESQATEKLRHDIGENITEVFTSKLANSNCSPEVLSRLNSPLLVDSYSFSDKLNSEGIFKFDEMKLLEMMIRSTASRQPDEISEDELWRRFEGRIVMRRPAE